MHYPDEPPIQENDRFTSLTREWIEESAHLQYSYHFTWLGRPIIQYPQDIVAIQELILRIEPRVVVETGIAHGGGLVLYASLLQLTGGDSIAAGIDIGTRPHNREAIIAHPLADRIRLIDGSSVALEVFTQVEALTADRSPVLETV